MGKLIAKTANWRTYLASDGKAVEIERGGIQKMFVINLADLLEYERLIAKANGAIEVRRTIPLPADLEPDK
jgi:hypothetical protein